MAKYLKAVMREYHSLSDKDFVWFPFMHLRPAPHETIGLQKLLVMILCFGFYGAILWPLKQWVLSDEITWRGQLMFTLKCLVFFTVWFSGVTRPLWNQRARVLAQN